jgi:hypothetical protein
MTMTREWAARVAGRHAGTSGLPVTACPYDANGDDQERALTLIWVRARQAALRPAQLAAEAPDTTE